MHSSASPEPVPPPDFPVSIKNIITLPVLQALYLKPPSHLARLPALGWAPGLPLLAPQVTLTTLSLVLTATAPLSGPLS